MDDLRLSEVQIIVKNREQTKNIRWDYIGKYTSEKRKELLKYWWKKKKEEKKNTEPSGIEKDWVDEMRREWEVANKSAKVTYLVTEPPR